MSDADPTTLDDAEIDRLARQRELESGFRVAARRALALARRYRDEEGTAGGARERACIVQAHEWRRAVRDLHAGRPVPALPDSARPGLARARDDAAAPTSAGGGRKTG